MFYRAFVVGIILFWGWMTALLIRFELAPGDARTMPVPTERVWKLLFEHEELSSLTLLNGRRRIGELNVQPRRHPAAGGPFQQLTGTGSFVLDLPGVGSERMVFHGTLDFDEREQVRRVELAANFHDLDQPSVGTTVTVDGEPPRGVWHYAIRRGNTMVKENAGTIDTLFDDPDLRALGIDPAVFARIGREQGAGAEVSARHGTLHVNGEDVETYVVTIRQAGGLESSVHLNPLGRILAIKTFLGYDLYDDAFSP